MTKTDKLGLPQWEATDQVQRTDFNDAFAILDNGYAAAEMATAGLARARALAERLGRDAYSLAAQQAVQHGSWGDGAAFWLNPLTTLAAAGGEGHGWNGTYGLGHGAAVTPTVEHIKETAEEISYLSTSTNASYQSTTAAVRFNSDGYGLLKTANIWLYTTKTSTEFTYTVYLYRDDTGEEVAQAGPFTSDYTQWVDVSLNFPLDNGVTYRMEFTLPSDHKFVGQGGFLLAASARSSNTPPVAVALRDVLPTVTNTVEKPDAVTEALALVRWSGETAVSLQVNGTDLTAAAERETINALGETCKETTYDVTLSDGPITVTLSLPQEDTAEFTVYDYGLIWR
jgi:hypothetical protein